MIKEKLSGTYNEHLKGLILEPLDGKEIVISSNIRLGGQSYDSSKMAPFWHQNL
jgi:hypothetical protein